MASYDDYEQDIAWSSSPAQPQDTGNVLKDAMLKEEVIKNIVAGQEDLKVLLQKVKTVQSDVDKLTSENATLQTYIDNLTKQLARR